MFGRVGHQLVDVGNRHGRNDEGHVDEGLPQQNLFIEVGGVDEGLEQMDRRNADDGSGQLDLEYVGVDV